MTADPGPWLLDITRLVSRIGRGPLTGVDRVELAYLRALDARPGPLFLLLRTPYGFLLLSRNAIPAIEAWLAAPETLPSESLPDRMLRRLGARARAEAGLRAVAIGRAPHWRLTRLLGRHLPQGSTYLNVGHHNLSARVLRRIKAAGLRLAVLIHDTIPVDFPQFGKPRDAARFRRKLAAAAVHADRILTISRAVETDIRRLCIQVPPITVAPLGIHIAAATPETVPQTLDLSAPYFVIVGTIEPRKNLSLLLDVWEGFYRDGVANIPKLFVIGRRGPEKPDVLQRLDDAAGFGVQQLPNLDDGAVAAIVQNARALLMPSFAEGFGLPVSEAAARGVPVICNDLPVYRETLGDIPTYIPVDQPKAWAHTILTHAETGTGQRESGAISTPTWTEHFNIVLKDI